MPHGLTSLRCEQFLHAPRADGGRPKPVVADGRWHASGVQVPPSVRRRCAHPHSRHQVSTVRPPSLSAPGQYGAPTFSLGTRSVRCAHPLLAPGQYYAPTLSLGTRSVLCAHHHSQRQVSFVMSVGKSVKFIHFVGKLPPWE